MRLAAFLVSTLLVTAAAYSQTPEAVSSGSQTPDPLTTPAPYGLIMDAATGDTLYCKQCDTPLIPASMSKLMVYYIVFERLRDGRLAMDDEFTVSEHSWRTGGGGTDGSTMFLSLNSRVRIEDLLRGAIIQSGNDACITLAEGISGSETAFAAEMTKRAKEIGLSKSTFGNATGLDHPDSRMSARDIGTLTRKIVTEFPEYYHMFSEPEFTWNGIRQPNRNPLLREIPGADGVKTGHLEVSGFGLVGSAVRDGNRRIIVLQGLASEKERRTESARVMRAAFTDFKTVELARAGSVVATADVWLGEKASVPLQIDRDLQIVAHVDSIRGITSIVHFKSPIAAPISAGDELGEIVFSGPGIEEIRAPVRAAEDVAKVGILGRAMIGLRGGS